MKTFAQRHPRDTSIVQFCRDGYTLNVHTLWKIAVVTWHTVCGELSVTVGLESGEMHQMRMPIDDIGYSDTNLQHEEVLG